MGVLLLKVIAHISAQALIRAFARRVCPTPGGRAEFLRSLQCQAESSVALYISSLSLYNSSLVLYNSSLALYSLGWSS